LGARMSPQIAEEVRELTDDGKKALNDFVMPFYTGNDFQPGSTDVGDVSWQTPTAQITTATFTSGAPGHSWQNVSLGATSLGDKGLLYAARVLCGAAADLFLNPEILTEARAEFENRTREGYLCPIPEGAPLYVIED